ncbi:MAG TPA: cytochrome c [Gemmatimonadales bacterium]|nr:cytochrome c [Gemmatimonadales bacterium]
MRRVVRVLKWAAIVVVVAGVGLGIYVARYWDRTWDVPEPDLHASTEPAVIARGEYLVYGPAHCAVCHTGSVEEYERFVDTGMPPTLAGGYPLGLGPLGTLYARNLTPDRDTGIGRYTDGQIARLMRHGVRPDGQASIPLLMPFSEMSDADVVAVISFLRSLPPVRRETPQNEWTTFGKVMRTFVAAARPELDGRPPKESPPQELSAARGEYLARSVADCIGCHSPFNQVTGALTGPEFSGATALVEPVPLKDVDTSMWFMPPNITPLRGSAFAKFPDRATFVARFKVGGRKYPGSPMPWEAFARMTPEDIGAIYEFLLTVPPAGEPAPDDPQVKQ